MSSNPNFKQLRVAVVGGGLGGLSAAVALRRAGHIGASIFILRCERSLPKEHNSTVEIYERRDFNVEVGASISCAANGTQWLREWEVDIPDMKPVILVHHFSFEIRTVADGGEDETGYARLGDWKDSEPV
ncbi:hypothetical protein D9758_001390 [Tetrapyrgos nigripes]|uniref:Uncharacterized protein n=1 Tax=Tetrapyrgos nigripes TaxID=182062 RepID=A0A8H5GRR8_9AGAR|nr:hypothetical protein D9758_001390 [Tetrapyrgos nigripes]